MAFADSGGSGWDGAQFQVGAHRGADRGHGWYGRNATVTLMNAAGRMVGRVWLREDRWDGVVRLFARVRDLPPDRFARRSLRDADGSAVMIHSGPDNFANIPARYGGPDQEMLATGDSGSLIACGVVR